MPGSILASEIRVGANGVLYVAPTGTTAPVNITSPWTSWTNLGYLDEEGGKLARSMTTEQVKAWQSIATVRYLITEVNFTIAMNLLQWNKDTISFYMGGGSVVAQGGGSYKYTISSAPTLDERMLGLEWTDGASITYRAIIGRGMVTETSESNITRGDAIKLPITFAAMSPATGTEMAYILTNDTAFA